MTRNLVEDTDEPDGRTDSFSNEPGPPASPPRRRWLRRLLLGTVTLALALGASAYAYPRHRDAAVMALLSLPHQRAVVGALESFGHRKAVVAAAPQPPIVRTAIVAAASGREAHFTGVVHARYESALGFRVAGKIVERLVDAGERVHKDQPLMRLDPTDLDLALRAAHSEVDAARAMVTQTTAEEARQRDLVSKNQAPLQAYERGKAAADSAAAKLTAALAQERQSEHQAAYAVLLADAGGVIMEAQGEPGQVVAVGQPVARLARDGAREAEVYIPEDEKAAETVSAALYATPHTWFPGKLRELSPTADPLTRTFRARYVLDGDGRNAALGTTVTIRSPKSDADPGVTVPAGAVFDNGDGAKVWVVDHASSQVEARSVRVLHVGDEDTAVAGNLQPGERVVALGAHLLKAGEKVGIDRAPTETAAR